MHSHKKNLTTTQLQAVIYQVPQVAAVNCHWPLKVSRSQAWLPHPNKHLGFPKSKNQKLLQNCLQRNFKIQLTFSKVFSKCRWIGCLMRILNMSWKIKRRKYKSSRKRLRWKKNYLSRIRKGGFSNFWIDRLKQLLIMRSADSKWKKARFQ